LKEFSTQEIEFKQRKANLSREQNVTLREIKYGFSSSELNVA